MVNRQFGDVPETSSSATPAPNFDNHPLNEVIKITKLNDLRATQARLAGVDNLVRVNFQKRTVALDSSALVLSPETKVLAVEAFAALAYDDYALPKKMNALSNGKFAFSGLTREDLGQMQSDSKDLDPSQLKAVKYLYDQFPAISADQKVVTANDLKEYVIKHNLREDVMLALQTRTDSSVVPRPDTGSQEQSPNLEGGQKRTSNVPDTSQTQCEKNDPSKSPQQPDLYGYDGTNQLGPCNGNAPNAQSTDATAGKPPDLYGGRNENIANESNQNKSQTLSQPDLYAGGNKPDDTRIPEKSKVSEPPTNPESVSPPKKDTDSKTEQSGCEVWGDRQFRVRADGSAVYEVKKGDCVWWVAEDVLKHRLLRKPTNAEIQCETESIAGASGLTKAPRNPDLIYPGDKLIIPPANPKVEQSQQRAKKSPPETPENPDSSTSGRPTVSDKERTEKTEQSKQERENRQEKLSEKEAFIEMLKNNGALLRHVNDLTQGKLVGTVSEQGQPKGDAEGVTLEEFKTIASKDAQLSDRQRLALQVIIDDFGAISSNHTTVTVNDLRDYAIKNNILKGVTSSDVQDNSAKR